MPNETNSILYRIIQEATRNAIRHANATNLDVVLGTTETIVSLRISDNGQGFDQGADVTANPGHLGLSIMADVVTEAGGRFDIDSAPESGTEVRVELPL